MLDDFREWVSDNLRYILLVLAAILLVVIAFFAIRLVSSLGAPKEKKAETEQVSTEAETERSSEKQASVSLTSNDPDLLNLMTKYYTALASDDTATLAAICENVEVANDEKKENAGIESYSNIKTYSRSGMTDGTYIVYIYFDAKITGIETLAPKLSQHYVVTDVEGNLMVSDRNSSQELNDFVEQAATSADVQALIQDVNSLLAERQEQDEDLKNLVVSASGPQSDGGDGGGDEGSGTGTSSSGTMLVTEAINVRSEASASSTLLGTLYQGTEVSVVENLDSGWSHIQYTTGDGVAMDGYVMTQYLTSSTTG